MSGHNFVGYESPRISRRRLLNAAAGLSLVSVLGGCRPVTAARALPQQGADAPGAGHTPEIFVDYEYGDLKEAVVGIPFGIYPDLDA
ncbi:MAG: hypothetical protein U0X20_32130, partial [Caldilineaceae bacterium]